MAAEVVGFPLTIAVELEVDGNEVPGPFGGPVYAGTTRWLADHRVVAAPGVYESTAGPARVRVTVTSRPERPLLALDVAVSPNGDGELLLRDVRVQLVLEDAAGWTVEMPGNTVRAGVEATAIAGAVTVLGPGHMLGSPGLVALHRPEELTALVWPFSRNEPASTEVRRDGSGLVVEVDTGLAGAVAPGTWLEHGPILLDAVDRDWADLVQELQGWYPAIGVRTPDDRPGWAQTASIFEVMVGAAPFRGGVQYEPYPTIGDLVADLDRIADLGFDCLQVMPRHPYPSYNIHEPGDIATTYGDPEELRHLVDESHRRDLRIILDILLHGVIDKEVMARTLAHVERGTYADRLDEACDDVYDPLSEVISWSRHIVEFATAWSAGAPEHHPLLDEHPEWFMRNSAGAVIGNYTHALDIANEQWQEHFIEGCAAIVGELDIDGFRVDAPLYNRFANWSPATRHHASHSSPAAFELLHKLRRRLHKISGELLLHSECGGPLARESLDTCYSYDEKWLPDVVFNRRQPAGSEWRRIRNGRDLARWCRDLDAATPAGSVSAHFIDVHDTMWWRLPGDWWRRQQIGLDATKAALVIHGLRGGAYMTFVGGELGIEDELARVHSLRRGRPELGDGVADYDAVTCDDEAIYCVIRRTQDSAAIVAVNTSNQEVHCTCMVDPRVPLADDTAQLTDLWNADQIDHQIDDHAVTVTLTFHPYQPRVIARA